MAISVALNEFNRKKDTKDLSMVLNQFEFGYTGFTILRQKTLAWDLFVKLHFFG